MSAMKKKKSAKSNDRQQQMTILSIIVAAVVIALLAVIYLAGRQSAKSNVNYDELEQARLADGGYLLGDPDAPITIVEFADFLCGHCQTYKATINRVIEELVVTGQASFEFRMIPTASGSENLFRLAECFAATEDSNFWEAHDEMFSLASNYVRPDEIGGKAAENLNVSYGELLECASTLQRNGTEQYKADGIAGDAVGVRGTPTVMVRYGIDSEMVALSSTQPSFSMIKTAVENAQ